MFGGGVVEKERLVSRSWSLYGGTWVVGVGDLKLKIFCCISYAISTFETVCLQ